MIATTIINSSSENPRRRLDFFALSVICKTIPLSFLLVTFSERPCPGRPRQLSLNRQGWGAPIAAPLSKQVFHQGAHPPRSRKPKREPSGEVTDATQLTR